MSDPLLLYSTNVKLKFLIQQEFRSDTHFVWCSDAFDQTKLPGYSLNSHTPASSNPAEIYRQLVKDIRTSDKHSAKIAEQRASLMKRALDWAKAGEITPAQKSDIVYLVKTASFSEWQPLIYIIPFPAVCARLVQVPANKRAGMGMEYTIADLNRSEFDIIEV